MHITEQAEARPGSRRQVLFLPLEDPRVTPMLTDLIAEYSARYGNRFGGAEQEMRRYPAAEFAAPGGTLLVVVEDGATVAGGAFRRFDGRTAELKRIWTAASHRRRGLARFVLTELEDEALRRGYSRIYLTTGPRQPEARELYLRTGYRPLFDTAADPEEVGLLAFDKELSAGGATAPAASVNTPAAARHTLHQQHPNHPTGV